jgi:hypothetical protein
MSVSGIRKIVRSSKQFTIGRVVKLCQLPLMYVTLPPAMAKLSGTMSLPPSILNLKDRCKRARNMKLASVFLTASAAYFGGLPQRL